MWDVSATPRPLYPVKHTPCPLYRGLRGPCGLPGRAGKMSPQRGSNPGTSLYRLHNPGAATLYRIIKMFFLTRIFSNTFVAEKLFSYEGVDINGTCILRNVATVRPAQYKNCIELNTHHYQIRITTFRIKPHYISNKFHQILMYNTEHCKKFPSCVHFMQSMINSTVLRSVSRRDKI